MISVATVVIGVMTMSADTVMNSDVVAMRSVMTVIISAL